MQTGFRFSEFMIDFFKCKYIKCFCSSEEMWNVAIEGDLRENLNENNVKIGRHNMFQ